VLIEVHLARSGYTGFRFARARSISEALIAIDRDRPDVALVDLAGDGIGPDAVEVLCARAPGLPVVAIVAPGEDAGRLARAHGASDVLPLRSDRPTVLPRVLLHAIERRRLERDIARARRERDEARARFDVLFHAPGLGVAFATEDGRLVEVSPAFAALLDRPAEELCGTRLQDLVADAALDDDALERLEGRIGAHETRECRLIARDGSRVWVLLLLEAIGPAAGGASRLLVRVRDIRAAKEAEAALHRRNVQLVERVVAALAEVTVVDEALRIGVREVCDAFGWEVGHAFLAAFEGPHRVLLPTGVWQLADGEQFAAFRDAAPSARFPLGEGNPGQALATGAAVWTSAVDPGDPRAAAAEVAGLKTAMCFPLRIGAEVAGAIECFTTRALPPDPAVGDAMAQIGGQIGRVIERKRLDARLAYHALHDPLTGLPNRVLFTDRLRQALQKLERSGARLAILFMDLDGFKEINDQAGHEAGDALLVALGQRLRGLVRPGDTVARFGGDEFTVLCEEVAGEDEAAGIAERIVRGLEEPFVSGRGPVEVSASIGIAIGSAPDEAPEELLRNADAAMYRTKATGGAGYEIHDRAARARVMSRRGAEQALRRAIDRRQLRLLYQPSIALASGAICGIEALVRWQHPERGLLEAEEIIPVAERSGLIVPLGGWVIEEACRQASRWRATLPGDLHPSVWVNLSLRQLHAGTLPEAVALALRKTGLDPRALCFEITESAIMDNLESSASSLARLKQLGIGLSIDDFGTGYSSLASLRRLPVGQLKIDRSFVEGLGQSDRDNAIVAAVIDLAHALELQVVAEGVETREQLDRLRALGCDGAQGFLFARPLPAEAMETLLQSRPRW
jgi:diguanylate cyclase (GGDEF)-like protein/PAS domain S-box-containing protein